MTRTHLQADFHQQRRKKEKKEEKKRKGEKQKSEENLPQKETDWRTE